MKVAGHCEPLTAEAGHCRRQSHRRVLRLTESSGTARPQQRLALNLTNPQPCLLRKSAGCRRPLPTSKAAGHCEPLATEAGHCRKQSHCRALRLTESSGTARPKQRLAPNLTNPQPFSACEVVTPRSSLERRALCSPCSSVITPRSSLERSAHALEDPEKGCTGIWHIHLTAPISRRQPPPGVRTRYLQPYLTQHLAQGGLA